LKDKQSLSYGLNNNNNNNNSNQRPIKDIILQHPDKVIIGYDDYRHVFYAIESKDRVHTLILGETGSGKSETLKLLMYHNILHKEGFMLIDPHGMLARDILQLLRKEYTEQEFNDKVIYI
jgi:energy-coupling factor transporter ATP-binding protein EcfA2